MTTFDARQLREQGMPQSLVAFAEWAATQDISVLMQVIACVSVIVDVEHGVLVAHTPFGDIPNLWAMERAADELRKIAQEAGLWEVAQYHEGTWQRAQTMIEGLVDVLRVAAE